MSLGPGPAGASGMGSHRALGFAGIGLLALGSALAGRLAAVQVGGAQPPPPPSTPLHDPNAAPRQVAPAGGFGPEERRTIELFRRASPSVVHIETFRNAVSLFRFDIENIPQGSGSGFLWDQKGHVVTNYHVIRGADRALVSLQDHTSQYARLVGQEPSKDIAVLKIELPPERLRPIPVGTSHDLAVGQNVFAIGNPFGLDQTLTTGVISGLGREILSIAGTPIEGVIQTDAAINPGNSGGALLDSSGRLIGMNTAIYSPSGVSVGIGYAVPVDVIQRIVTQLIRYGKVTRPGLGVALASDRTNRSLGLDGLLVLQVARGSEAERAGLRPTLRTRDGQLVLGDVVVAVGGKRVENSVDLFRVLDEHEVGDRVEVTVARGEALKTLVLPLVPAR